MADLRRNITARGKDDSDVHAFYTNVVSLCNELRTDHGTSKTGVDETKTLIDELHDDHATIKTSTDELIDDHLGTGLRLQVCLVVIRVHHGLPQRQVASGLAPAQVDLWAGHPLYELVGRIIVRAAFEDSQVGSAYTRGVLLALGHESNSKFIGTYAA